jgi:hypothetical protein
MPGRTRHRTPAHTASQPIRINNTVVELSLLRAATGRYARELAEAKAAVGHAECLCTDPPQKLVIRSRSDRFHLACWPEQGGRHNRWCEFHRVSGQFSGRSGYRRDAITEDENGTSIKVAFSLQVRLDARPRLALTTHRDGEPRARARASVGLLGLLHYLWERADLTTWSAGQHRHWAECWTQLRADVDDTTLSERPGVQALYVIAPYRPDTVAARDVAFAAFTASLGHHGATSTRGLILGEIKSLEETKYGGWRFNLRHTNTALYASDVLVAKMRQSFRSTFAAALPSGARQMGLFLIERTPRGYLQVVDAAAMLTSASYIPCDSSHEVTMADRLAEAGRSFVKPVRYDGSTETFPDFILTDTDPLTYVEVWGITGRQDYEQRKRDKQAYHQQTGRPIIEWDVRDELPSLTPDPRAS